MDTKNIERYLNSFGKQVVNRAKGILQKKKGGGTNLEKSLKYKVIVTSNGYSLQFFMADYGTFLDRGVSGNRNTVRFKNFENKDEVSPYAYTTKGPPIDILSKWIKKKNIKPKGLGRGRDKKTGQFVSGFAYLISKKIKREGINSLAFFQKPLGLGLKQFGPKLGESFVNDVIDGVKNAKVKSVKVTITKT